MIGIWNCWHGHGQQITTTRRVTTRARRVCTCWVVMVPKSSVQPHFVDHNDQFLEPSTPTHLVSRQQSDPWHSCFVAKTVNRLRQVIGGCHTGNASTNNHYHGRVGGLRRLRHCGGVIICDGGLLHEEHKKGNWNLKTLTGVFSNSKPALLVLQATDVRRQFA